MTKIRSNAPWILAAFILSVGFVGCGGQSGTEEQAVEEMPAETPMEMPTDTTMADSAMADTVMSP